MPDKNSDTAVMTARQSTRRTFLARAAIIACAAGPFRPALAQGVAGRVLVIGGGFAGATCARALKRLDGRISVTLVEPNMIYIACSFSNGIIAGLRHLRDQAFS
jgi:NADPH-dependent 2,4-dienoyl-CoA reductase/sulfur reductase-like enzyme